MKARMGLVIWLLLVACNAPPAEPLPKIPQNQAPQIDHLELSPASGVAPMPTKLSWALTNPDNQTLRCMVDFDGDGAADLLVANCGNFSQDYTYAQPGNYTLKLRLEDSHGAVVEQTQQVEVQPNSSPVIKSFSASVAAGRVPLPVSYRWNISDPNGDPLTCKLDVNNTGTFEYVIPNCDSSLSRSFSFVNPSDYFARLRVEDSRGAAVEKVLETPVYAAPNQYDITLRINGPISDSVRLAFDNARKFWSQAITKSLTFEPSFSISANACLGNFPAFKGPVNNLLIDVQVVPIDGLGGVRGQAGACRTHGDSFLTLYGIMQFDSADLEDIAQQGLLNRLILHEMGHVLGFGTLWDFKRSLIVGAGAAGACGSNPVFVGSNALREWQALGGSGNVPLENSGGAGTCNAHWKESSFGNELMTGFLNPGSNPVSRLTLASLEDLGYSVNYAASESYTLPVGVSSLSLEQRFPVKLIRPVGVWR